MKLVVLGDLHLISPDDPFKEAHQSRSLFARTWESLQTMIRLIRAESPDLVISLGDLVDWYSEENRDFALNLLEEMGVPWVATGGNHDYALYERGPNGVVGPFSTPEGRAFAERGWQARGIELGNRLIDTPDAQLILVDSAVSSIPDGTEAWLAETKREGVRRLVFTHVPLNIPPVVEYILSVDPGRSLEKYVQSGAPRLFDECLRHQVDAVYSAHLHFPGRLEVDGTEMHMLSMSTVSDEKHFEGQGAAVVLDTLQSQPRVLVV